MIQMIQPIFRMKGVLRVKIKLIQDAAAAECITHAGTFHADEVFATVILGKVFGSLSLCRVNSVPAEVREGVIVYDIGQGELDHHQRGGNGTRDNGVPYAASGLVWKRYGKKLTESTCDSKLVWDLIDCELIQGIDAIDNGVLLQTDRAEKCLNVSDLIRMMNPLWNTGESFDEAFYKAVSLAETIFDRVYESAVSKAAAKQKVELAVHNTAGNIMVLEQYIPWQQFIFDSADPKAEEILFVVFPSARGGFNCQCVPDVPGGYGQRKAMPKEWRGLTGEELQKVTGVPDAVFCHPAGFIGGAETLEGAVEMAKRAVE